MPLLYAVVASGSQVSGDVDLRQFALTGISLPVVTSGSMLLRGNYDTTSANFFRLNDDQGDIQFATAAGSKMVLWPMGFMHPAYVRVELSVAQTDNRTIVMLTRPL